jgi:hypothetical protein
MIGQKGLARGKAIEMVILDFSNANIFFSFLASTKRKS